MPNQHMDSAEARVEELERENAQLRKALRAVLSSAQPHPVENVAMYEAWQAAKKVL